MESANFKRLIKKDPKHYQFYEIKRLKKACLIEENDDETWFNILMVDLKDTQFYKGEGPDKLKDVSYCTQKHPGVDSLRKTLP